MKNLNQSLFIVFEVCLALYALGNVLLGDGTISDYGYLVFLAVVAVLDIIRRVAKGRV